jgi:hypothetical protein
VTNSGQILTLFETTQFSFLNENQYVMGLDIQFFAAKSATLSKKTTEI